MRFERPSHRRGELLAAAGGLVLLVVLFALKWYGPGAITSTETAAVAVNGWHGLIHLRWLMLLTIISPFVPVLAATRRVRGRPVAVSAVVTLGLGVATLLWLGYRVLISIPPGQKPAPYIALVCVLAIVIGGALSLRSEPATMDR